MRHLAAMNAIQELDVDRYQLSNFSRSLTSPVYAAGYPCMWAVLPCSRIRPQTDQDRALGAMSAIYHLPRYLARTGYQDPCNSTDGPFQSAVRTRQHWFAWATDHPPVASYFNQHMAAYHQGRPSWMDVDFYPVAERLIDGVDLDQSPVLLVDIGGSLGHDLVEFHRKHPTAPGRLVLQDRTSVVEQVPALPPVVDVMAQDFFEPQPVRGARAYYLHSVLHDWPDDQCQRILRHIAVAMRAGYSTLLICENVVPRAGAGWEVTSLDLMVMTLTSARERTDRDWQRLLHAAGFRIVKIWSHIHGVESLIECVLENDPRHG
jgi:hypothetical protein